MSPELEVSRGVLIDTQAYELKLPSDKLNRLQALLDRWLPRRSCTKKDLESLIGHLSHVATVVGKIGSIYFHLSSVLGENVGVNVFIIVK